MKPTRGDGQHRRSNSGDRRQSIPPHKVDQRSYAWAVTREYRAGQREKQGQGAHRISLSYEADESDLLRLKKAFVGVVAQPGMSYNIQNIFHTQGYFGVKVTPLGANLTLLEGQEEGEVQALMEDAKEWLKQWFAEIRPWSTKDLDTKRTIWLRVYGIPSHAWNDQFFAQLVQPWGAYINSDDGTMKKFTMDVARLMIRTSCQQVVDEFIDVKVNDEIFHLRVLEEMMKGNRRTGRRKMRWRRRNTVCP
jgi:hypothetical protein